MGCQRGLDHYKDWQKDLVARKRDHKAKYKELRDAVPADKQGEYDRKLWPELENAYILTLRRFNLEPNLFCQTYADFSDNHWATLLRHYNILERHYENALKLKAPVPTWKDPLATLKNFCKGFTAACSPTECVKRVNEAKHGLALRQVYRLFFKNRGKTKKHVVWMHGVANSGKSQFIRRLREIFGVDEVDWRGEWLPVRQRSNAHIKTQMVTCEEFNHLNAFSGRGKQVTKLLFEGEGASVRENLYKGF